MIQRVIQFYIGNSTNKSAINSMKISSRSILSCLVLTASAMQPCAPCWQVVFSGLRSLILIFFYWVYVIYVVFALTKRSHELLCFLICDITVLVLYVALSPLRKCLYSVYSVLLLLPNWETS